MVMAQQQNNKKSQRDMKAGARHTDKEPSLKGTFTSVMLLGLFLVVSWVGVFILFLNRG